MEINEQLKQNMLKLNAEEAMRLYKEFGDSSALSTLVLDGSPELLQLPEARHLIAMLLSSSPKQKRGAPKQQQADFRNLQMLCCLYYLKGAGIPISGDYKDGTETACEIVGKHFHRSAEQVRKKVWQGHTKQNLFDAYLKAGADSGYLAPHK